jgi:hypothetical protein
MSMRDRLPRGLMLGQLDCDSIDTYSTYTMLWHCIAVGAEVEAEQEESGGSAILANYQRYYTTFSSCIDVHVLSEVNRPCY